MADSDDEAPTLVEAAPSSSAGPNSGPTEGRKRPVPVTLITGALGAGKTTLIRYILHQPHGYKIAVILNEVGEEQGLEQSMVLPVQGAAGAPDAAPSWVELSNGCLCCSVKSEFLSALETLLLSDYSYDYVLIEATGLADPGPIAASLWTDGPLECEVCLDAIVTLVDAKNLPRQLEQQRPAGTVNEVERQLAYADVILLNKVDLLPDATAEAVVTTAIRAMNAAAVVHPTQHSTIDLQLILNQRQYSGADAATQLPEKLLGASFDVPVPEHNCGGDACAHDQPDEQHGACATNPAQCQTLGHQQSAHVHDQRTQTINLVCKGPLDEDRFRRFVEGLLWEQQADGRMVFRMKGLVTLAQHGRRQGPAHRHMLQGVFELYDLYPGPVWREGEDCRNRLLIVGRQLDKVQLQQQLQSCVSAEHF